VARVAFGDSSGCVGVVDVTQVVQHMMSTSTFGIDFKVGMTVESASDEICSPDDRGLTSLKWIGTLHEVGVHAYIKPASS
jgi:hypothetical protein